MAAERSRAYHSNVNNPMIYRRWGISPRPEDRSNIRLDLFHHDGKITESYSRSAKIKSAQIHAANLLMKA